LGHFITPEENDSEAGVEGGYRIRLSEERVEIRDCLLTLLSTSVLELRFLDGSVFMRGCSVTDDNTCEDSIGF
jgi:hypothetical protein